MRLGDGRCLVKTGTVKWFNPRKGYGVIMPVDGGFNAYVNIKTIQLAGLAELKEGQTVHFDIVSEDHIGRIFAGNLKAPPNRNEDVFLPHQIPASATVVSATYTMICGYMSGARRLLLAVLSGMKPISASPPHLSTRSLTEQFPVGKTWSAIKPNATLVG
jgi:cold shock protein